MIIERLDPSDEKMINQIAEWYLDEWKIPVETTVQRLSAHSKDDVLFQLVLSKNNNPIATGGLYNNVGILKIFPEFKKLKPWVALLYTTIENRNKGIGKILLDAIEQHSKEMGFDRIYLFTFTAEALYKRNGWRQLERVSYKDHNTVVMEKEI